MLLLIAVTGDTATQKTRSTDLRLDTFEYRRLPTSGVDRAIEQSITRPRPVWLTEQEVDLEHDPAVVPTAPSPAIAYVRFHEAAVRPEVEVVAWNEHAVRIRFTARDGQVHEGWVWKDAVRSSPARRIVRRR